ncbi:MAG: serine hydrolase [Pyrinomonadaceae bacterium]
MGNTKASAIRLCGALALGLVAAFGCAAQTRPDARALGEQAELYLRDLVRQNRFGGAVLVARDGEVLLHKGYGMADLENDVPNVAETKFLIGSVTNQFTAVSVLMLSERGKLDLRDPVCKYVDGCPEEWRPMTIRHLLTHASGLPDYNTFAATDPSAASPALAVVERLKKKPLEFKPGEKFGFSNPGYILLGLVIEKVSGASYENFLRENILAPLKMNDTGYDKPLEIVKRRASGYLRRGSENVKAPCYDVTPHHASGALYSTVRDLYVWDQALSAGKLISRKALDEMTKPQQANYGYGVFVDDRFSLRRVSHAGDMPGFNSFIARYPEQNALVVVLSNYAGTNPLEVGGKLTNIYLNDKIVAPAVAGLDAELLKEYVGRYTVEAKASSNFVFDVTLEGGQLWAKPSHFEKHRLIPFSKTEFYDEEDLGDTQYVFTRDDKGKVNGFVHREPADSFVAYKVELPPPSLKGNTTFRLKGHADASVVALAGSFNNWQQTHTLFAREGDEWVCRVDLPPGKHAYKFVVDGNWMLDPGNPRTENDGNGNVNSILITR